MASIRKSQQNRKQNRIGTRRSPLRTSPILAVKAGSRGELIITIGNPLVTALHWLGGALISVLLQLITHIWPFIHFTGLS